MSDAPLPGVFQLTPLNPDFNADPHKLTLANLNPALEIALKWAEANKVTVWQTVDGVTSKLPNGGVKPDGDGGSATGALACMTLLLWGSIHSLITAGRSTP